MGEETDELTDVPALVHAERRRLLSLAYRMLGTTAEAEDAVQETYVRWYRMTEAERAAVGNPQGWLTRAASRICLDVLGSARHRRERYVGEWLPEPVPAQHFTGTAPVDPFERVSLDESVSTAVLVVMEAMTPAERVAFVLHDVFAYPFDEVAAVVGRSPAAVRQLASSARRRVREHGALDVDRGLDRGAHDEVVRAFAHAAGTGDLAALSALLDPSVTLRSDGGGVVSAARRPVLGVSNVARFVLGIAQKDPVLRLEAVRTGDGLAFRMVRGGEVRGVVNFKVVDGLVRDVWIQLNPAKLRVWTHEEGRA
ncbi:RNA polymerase sigma factor SigJ [Kineococcus rhizosphaerae]|uniref:RNA polymerase sigma-70 factor (ECF subfamily) n=1 Tax=Kineococcus rhizosphaerae TaxID=559628 RepID=A0A2T0R629_9ACTN|nr:RNA polymerase sigma factor SigJ [Kineococcus rhizosphaerae]PRY16601.1 RNA polymerase sigma-70 factor (ECF subfamily) [Kineococcus rhizosphaerae]